MQHQQSLLIGRLDGHEPHRWSRHGLADGGSIGNIVLRSLDIALHVTWRHQTHGMTKFGEFTYPMMRGSAGFHADQAIRNLAKEVDDLLAPQLTADDDFALTIHAVHTIDAGSERRPLHHFRPILPAPPAIDVRLCPKSDSDERTAKAGTAVLPPQLCTNFSAGWRGFGSSIVRYVRRN